MADKDLRFTVYRPQTMSAGIWASLLVVAHKTDLVVEPGRPPFDPNTQVEAIARAHFGNMLVPKASVDARSEVFRGARLRIEIDLPDILCNPRDAEFDWWEPVHHVVFRLRAESHLAGSVARGAVRIWRGPLILGEVSLAISIIASEPAVQPPLVADSAALYRKIFPSYSHRDGAIVDGFAEVARTFGDEYLREVIAIRAAQEWRSRLPQLIEEADIFQLFWSSNSMRSPYCRAEWEYALSLGRPLFVRPLYWEDPRPEDRASGLPPDALDALQFVKVALLAAHPRGPAPAHPAEADRGQPWGSSAGPHTGGMPSPQARPAEPHPGAHQAPPYEGAPGGPSYEGAPGGPSYEGAQRQGALTGGPSPGPPAARASRPRALARSGRLAVAALVLVLIVVAVIIVFYLLRR